MITVNPYADDPDKASAFESGYLWGFAHPTGDDNPPPYSPELIDVYLQGVDSGKDDGSRPPNGPSASSWALRSDLQNEEPPEWLEHLFIEGIAHFLERFYSVAAFGLAGVVLTVLGIPTDTPMQPLEDDFEETYGGAESDSNVFYVATCGRNDHPMAATGTTSEGYWAGAAYNDFGEAIKEAVAHEHAEALVARCSLTDKTCGLVWAAR